VKIAPHQNSSNVIPLLPFLLPLLRFVLAIVPPVRYCG
jgi:hypothetical protein